MSSKQRTAKRGAGEKMVHESHEMVPWIVCRRWMADGTMRLVPFRFCRNCVVQEEKVSDAHVVPNALQAPCVAGERTPKRKAVRNGK